MSATGHTVGGWRGSPHAPRSHGKLAYEACPKALSGRKDTGWYYLQSRYYDPIVKRFLNADVFTSTGQDFLGYNMFAYCGNNPIIREDNSGDFWNTFIGAAAGAIVGGLTAAIMGTDIKACVVSGALNGAITGAAVDIAIATGGVGIVAFAAVTVAGGVGGATSSYVNQRMNGISHKDVD